MNETVIEHITTAVSCVFAGLVFWQIVREARRQDAQEAAERAKRLAARDAFLKEKNRAQEQYWADMQRQMNAVDADWAEA